MHHVGTIIFSTVLFSIDAKIFFYITNYPFD